MPAANFLYVLGNNPYDYSSGRSTRGNGRWSMNAPDVETAVRAIFGAMVYPGEAVGRYAGVFQEGVALAGAHESEVVQVWTSDPAAVSLTSAFAKRIKGNSMEKASHHWGYAPHSGGIPLGLACEIHVSEIVKYLAAPVISGLLMNTGDDRAVSPLGASFAALTPSRRSELTHSLTLANIEIVRKKHGMESALETFREKKKTMEQQLHLATVYMSGIRSQEILMAGNRAPAGTPIHVFQKRQFLDNEIGLLANLVDMDADSMDDIDRWMVATEAWKKLLPYPRTILVTRITEKKREYKDPFVTAMMAHFNMQHVVWIRDGDRVMRIGTEVDFDGQLFPDPAQSTNLKRRIQEKIWECRYKPTTERNPDKPGLAPKGHNETLPYNLTSITPAQFATVDLWLDSPYYTPELEDEIADAVSEFIRERNQATLPFVVFLQGLVDNTDVLQIPAGTDLFLDENLSRYFRLVLDFSYGLPTTQFTGRMDALMNPANLRKGDWVIAVDPRSESDYAKLIVHRVTRVEAGNAFVKCRRVRNHREFKVEDETPLTGDFLPLNVPLDLAAAILDNRDWKSDHRLLVPALAQWTEVLARYGTAPANGTVIDLPKLRISGK